MSCPQDELLNSYVGPPMLIWIRIPALNPFGSARAYLQIRAQYWHPRREATSAQARAWALVAHILCTLSRGKLYKIAHIAKKGLCGLARPHFANRCDSYCMDCAKDGGTVSGGNCAGFQRRRHSKCFGDVHRI